MLHLWLNRNPCSIKCQVPYKYLSSSVTDNMFSHKVQFKRFTLIHFGFSDVICTYL